MLSPLIIRLLRRFLILILSTSIRFSNVWRRGLWRRLCLWMRLWGGFFVFYESARFKTYVFRNIVTSHALEIWDLRYSVQQQLAEAQKTSVAELWLSFGRHWHALISDLAKIILVFSTYASCRRAVVCYPVEHSTQFTNAFQSSWLQLEMMPLRNFGSGTLRTCRGW